MPIARALPSLNSDSSLVQSPTRTGPYLEAYTLGLGGGDSMFADEGSFFVANNALGTPVTGHAAPVVADTSTKALLHVFNGGTKNIIPIFLFLEVTTAGTNGTIHYTTIYVDAKGSTALSSGGTAFTPVNTNGRSQNSTGATLTFGACVTAMTSARLVGQQIVREVVPVVQDTIFIRFGGPNMGFHSALTTAGTATNHLVQHHAPVAIGPGGNLNISQIRPSQTVAAAYNFSFGYVER